MVMCWTSDMDFPCRCLYMGWAGGTIATSRLCQAPYFTGANGRFRDKPGPAPGARSQASPVTSERVSQVIGDAENLGFSGIIRCDTFTHLAAASSPPAATPGAGGASEPAGLGGAPQQRRPAGS